MTDPDATAPAPLTGPVPADETTAVDEPPIARHSIRRNMAQMGGSQVVTWTLTMATSIIVPRYLGSDLVGRVQLASSLWGIAAVFTAFGTSMYLSLAIARDQQRGLALVGPILAIRTALFLVVSVVLAAYVGWFENDTQFITIMLIASVATLFPLWSEVFGAAFIGLERMGIIALLDSLGKLFTLLATIAVILLGWGVYGVVGVVAVTAVLGFVIFVWRFTRIATIQWSGWRAQARPIMIASAPFMAVTLALIVYRQIDVIVISRVAGDRDVGWYATADLLAGSLLFPTTIIMTSIFPTFGRLFEEDQAELRSLVRRTYNVLLLAAVPIGFGAAVVGPTFAPLLFGDDFEGTGTALVIFGPVTVLSFGATLLAFLALATERSRFLALLLTAAAALTVVLDIFLVPLTSDRYDNGAIGGAIAYVVTEALQFVALLIVVAPFLVTRSWIWRNVRTVAAGGVMVAATLPFRDQFFLIPVAIGAVVYPIAVIAFRCIDADQRQMIGDLLARAGLRTKWAK